MSTICKICIKAKEDDVISFLKERLSSSQQEFAFSVTERALTAIEYDNFHINNDEPSILSCSQTTSKTTEIYFNSFSEMKALSSFLSKKINGFVVVNIYQSTGTAGYWSYHLKGELLREIEFGDFQILLDSGIKFDFEEDQIGRNIADSNEEAHYVFDSDDMDLYNLNIGLDVEVYQEHGAEWKNFKLKTNKKPTKIPQKKWWKFW